MSLQVELSLLIPTYNESKQITILLDLISQLPTFKSYQLIIINDGSTDNSHTIIENWLKSKKYKNVLYLSYQENQGKTKAIQIGLEHVQGKYTLIQDGDLEYDTMDIKRLLDFIKEKDLDSVIGFRKKKFQRLNIYDIALKSGVVLLTFMFNFLYKSDFKDLSGGYKIFKTQSFKAITLEGKGFTFCYEVVIKLLQNNFSIGQLDINYNPRSKEAGKKIRLRDGFFCFYTILKYFRF